MPTLRFGPLFLGPPSAEERTDLEAKAVKLPFSFQHVGITQAAPPLPADVEAEAWTVDHNRVKLGQGRAAYRKAQRLLQRWHHFDLGWASVNKAEMREGAPVVVTAKTLFAWSCNPLRISYVEERGLRGGQRPPWAPPPPPRAKGSTQLHTSCGGARESPSQGLARGGGGRAEWAAAQERSSGAAAHLPRGRRYAFAHTTLAGHQIQGEERFAVAWNHEDDSVWYEIYTLSRPGNWLTTATHPLLRLFQHKFAADSMAAMQRGMAEDEAPR
ncbi:hypothetical protein C2E20_2908 isoform X1 [Micractinium conductrix]|uniref:DUF1990 domain-containing protein n=1 Tax=Micractinium conductrix TaxID=554055 RepID=A0A2P6VI37_9CHLO|nr:hypothetical protein C2E20_2908 isoform X1 [Micractinium conductrix]|eukprot:PSC73763.1 hypothetical protein C2E20_2908 isoform X1 [Micractinium conductrix]